MSKNGRNTFFLCLLILITTALLADDEKKQGVILKALRSCDLVVKETGKTIELGSERTIMTAGVWFPPVSGCDAKAAVKGNKATAEVFYADDLKDCFHFNVHTGKMKKVGKGVTTAINKVIDLRGCVDVSPK